VNENKSKKERIDKLLVDRGLVSSRTRAQAMILAGHVLVDETPVMKSGEMVSLESNIRLREPELKYVSRGALKLKAALFHFHVSAKGKTALDIGSSTGGFSEVLLEEGAKKVYAVDAGTNQLAWKIRSDPRVISKENYNARYIKKEDFPDHIDLVVMDVSFISIRLILPALQAIVEPQTEYVVLFKPQFEVGREWIEEGGIVRDQLQVKKLIDETLQWGESIKLQAKGVMDSPIQGTDGNHEYLIHWLKTVE
jgi:23S rRNA (cytidine1920-2'-O)/16S rRNA (cytidine1409-2'-O)-methyltransferase